MEVTGLLGSLLNMQKDLDPLKPIPAPFWGRGETAWLALVVPAAAPSTCTAGSTPAA